MLLAAYASAGRPGVNLQESAASPCKKCYDGRGHEEPGGVGYARNNSHYSLKRTVLRNLSVIWKLSGHPLQKIAYSRKRNIRKALSFWEVPACWDWESWTNISLSAEVKYLSKYHGHVPSVTEPIFRSTKARSAMRWHCELWESTWWNWRVFLDILLRMTVFVMYWLAALCLLSEWQIFFVKPHGTKLEVGISEFIRSNYTYDSDQRSKKGP